LTDHDGCSVVTNMSYASRTEYDCFPETLVFVEGTEGSAEIHPGCQLRVSTREGTRAIDARPPAYSWADPAYALVHASIVECQRHLLQALRGLGPAETTAADNLRTLQLVFASYDSAASGQSIAIP
ncbi:MAG: gfo/Idh/MocA family oxidoreductase, partial [Verrucomicrobiales bacterium]